MKTSKWRDYPEYVVVHRVFNGDPNRWDCIKGFGDIEECKRALLDYNKQFPDDMQYVEVFRLEKVDFDIKLTSYIYDKEAEDEANNDLCESCGL